VCAFSGDYLGEDDGHFVASQTIAGLFAYGSVGLVLDFRELNYTQGITLIKVFKDVSETQNGEHDPLPFPVGICVSSKCQEGVLTLLKKDALDGFIRDDFAGLLGFLQGEAQRWLDA